MNKKKESRPEKVYEVDKKLFDKYEKVSKDSDKTLRELHKAWAEDCLFAKVPGRQWTDKERALRNTADFQRPTLEVNQVLPSNQSIINQVKQNPPSAHVIPISPTSGDVILQTSNVLEGLLRASSKNGGEDAKLHAFDCAVTGGFGAYYMAAEPVSSDSFDKELKFKRVLDPTSCRWDTNAVETDGSDMMWACIDENMGKEQFFENFPFIEKDFWKTLTSATGGNEYNASAWGEKDAPKIVNFFFKDSTDEMLYQLKTEDEDGNHLTAWKSEDPDENDFDLDEDGKPICEIRAKIKVRWVKMAAGYLLDEIEWPCENIPFYLVPGINVMVAGERHLIGATRYQKDAQKSYNYGFSGMVERAALAPKPHFIADSQSLSSEQQQNFETAHLHTKILFYSSTPKDMGNDRINPPIYVAPPDFDQGLLSFTEFSGEAIKTIGSNYNPVMGRNESDQSGKAIQYLTQNSQLVNVHFLKHFIAVENRAANDFLNLVPEYYSKARQLEIIGKDKTAQTVWINKSYTPKGTDNPITHDLASRKYKCLVEMGKSYETLTQQTSDWIDGQMKNPITAQAIPDLAWDAAASSAGIDSDIRIEGRERIKKLLPPILTQGQQQNPAALQQQLMQMHSQMQSMMGEFQKLQTENHDLKQKHDIDLMNAETKKFEAKGRYIAEMSKITSGEKLAHLDAIASHEEAHIEAATRIAEARTEAHVAFAGQQAAQVAAPQQNSETQNNA
jgi:Phage P22-like portal protein